jgi:peptidyl-prolyl cis-trans isomerase B (cyclophilin B)
MRRTMNIKTNKKITKIMTLIFLLMALSFTACSNSGNEVKKEYLTGLHHVEIDVQNYGTISLELSADDAPISVTNFVNLANEGFYNGLTFHRIISGFMIQGGDPDGNGTGGSGTTIKGEFSANNVENPISHTRGTISMARSQSNDSASSQFFIVHEDSLFLDGDYAGFGHVTQGMEIVDLICANTPVIDGNGTVSSENQPIITEIRVID